MTTTNKVIITIIVLAASFAAGRQSAPEKIKVETKIVTVDKIVTVVEHTTTTITKQPDGTTTTVIVSDKKTDNKTNTTSTASATEDSRRKKLNISALAGIGPSFNITELVYGASISKEVLGPITAGAWVLSNKSIGLSIGLNF